ncbi:MAG: PspC domain-containing protein [Actinomycetia bacterium]|nr:PspC domain-containing protein [Actinomycetes bacterium]
MTSGHKTIDWPFLRSVDKRMLTGVAGGIGERLGIHPIYVRAAFLSAMLAGGVGLIAYVLASLIVPEAKGPPESHSATTRQKIGIGAMFLAGMLLFQGIGLWFGPATWPIVLVLFGLAIAIDTSGFNYEQSLEGVVGSSRRPWWLVLGGLAMMIAGLAFVLTSLDGLQSVGALVIATILTLVGFVIVGGPWFWSLIEDLGTERRARIRSEERAEMAAHLHDSVLQSLALIQRTEDPKKMVTLARAQERDLRAWLYNPEAADEQTLRGALGAAATRVEEAHDVPVTVVVVGDDELPPAAQKALVGAATETMMNAAQHSGAAKVSVFAEATGDDVEVFITDQGCGFDPENVEADRKGITESIRGRMSRNGGTVTIDSSSGVGTEVHLTMPGGTL